MSFWQCEKCGGTPGVTWCCTDKSMTANTETEQLHQLLELVLTELDRKSIPFAYMQEIDRKGKAFIEQAARRAPAVPVPSRRPTLEEIEEAVGYHSSGWDCVDPSELIDAIMNIATAPKPPDDLKRGNPATKPDEGPSSCAHCGNPWGEAAPVELPEPVYTMRVRGRMHDYTPTLSAFDLADGEHALYTEQQVRQLLAARLKPLTDEQWTKIWADWFDSAQDAEDLIRSIEKAHGITQENQG